MKTKDGEGNRVVYVVQSTINMDEIYVFTENPVMCETMSKVTGSKWSAETIVYHTNKKKERKFEYRGYKIHVCAEIKGPSRGSIEKMLKKRFESIH
jgi:hypothetical protein